MVEKVPRNRFVIFGGGGFIGSSMARRLTGSNNQVVVVDNLSMTGEFQITPGVRNVESDCSRVSNVTSVLRDFEPSHIIHLAANSDIRASSVNPQADLKSTFQTSVAIALALVRLNLSVEHFVFASSSAIFGSKDEKIGELSDGLPESPYGWMKLASEKLFETFFDLKLVKHLHVMRFPNVTGPGQTHGVVKDLVAKYLDLSRPFDVLGDGMQTKPYIHVDDLIDVIMGELGRNLTPGTNILNISPEDSIKVREIVEIIEQRGQLERVPKFGQQPFGWIGDVPGYTYDISKLRSLGYDLRSSKAAIIESVDEEFHKHGK